METNAAEEKKRRVYLKPLNPRLTPEDRLDADLRLLSRALSAWERRMRPSPRHRPRLPWATNWNLGFDEFRQKNE